MACIAVYDQFELDHRSAGGRAGLPVGMHLDEPATYDVTILLPQAHASTVAGIPIAAVRVGLGHRAVAMEGEDVVAERCVRSHQEPHTGDWTVGHVVTTAASRRTPSSMDSSLTPAKLNRIVSLPSPGETWNALPGT